MKPFAVCCITNYRLDSDYIEEWCRHHLGLGFDLIYLMDDLKDMTHPLTDVPYIGKLVGNGIIKYIPRHDHPNQHGLYDGFYAEHRDEFSWCAFLDSDEFLSLPKHDSIKGFIADRELGLGENADVIQICWRNHGDNGRLFRTEGPTVDRFPSYGSDYMSKPIETKVIVRGGLQDVRFFIGHLALSENGLERVFFCDGTPMGQSTPFHVPNYEYAALDHYKTRSLEEFCWRKCWGRLDIPTDTAQKFFDDSERAYFDINERTPEKERAFRDYSHLYFERGLRRMTDKVVYTCITGGYDVLREVGNPNPEYDYICFTDAPFESDVWMMRPIPDELKDLSPVLQERMVKILPHKFLSSQYKLSVWVDGNCEFLRDVNELVNTLPKEKTMLFKKHPACDSTDDDIEANLKCGKISQSKADEIRTWYSVAGYSIKGKSVPFAETNLIVRKHQEAATIKTMEAWSEMVRNICHRDQLSLQYALRATNGNEYMAIMPCEVGVIGEKVNEATIIKFGAHKKTTVPDITLYQTYYRPSDRPADDSVPDFVIPYDVNSPQFPTNRLNKFWSEFIVMRNIWKQGKKTKYIGFEQYDVHFPYSQLKTRLDKGKVLSYGKIYAWGGIRSQFNRCHYHGDMDIALDIVGEQYGADSDYVRYLTTNTLFYYKSCFVMSWERYDSMCSFVFGILEEIDRRYGLDMDYQKYEAFMKQRIENQTYRGNIDATYDGQRRFMGFLGERLISAWVYCNVPKTDIVVTQGIKGEPVPEPNMVIRRVPSFKGLNDNVARKVSAMFRYNL